MKKRIVTLFLAGVMVLSLCACDGNNKAGTSVADSDPLTKEDVIEVVTVSHASWPYRDDWKVWEYIAEGSGATVNVTAIPGSDAATKYAMYFAAPETLPDVMNDSHKPTTDKYVLQGALIALDDMKEYMPNYNAWLETLTEEEYANNVNLRKAYDGKIYYSPVIGRERSENVRAWMYRKDIFDKHGIAVPETFDELYEACKELKAIYPESYPFGVRQGTQVMDVTGPSWKPYWTTNVYYDYNAEKWCYGAVESTMREVIEFYKKMYDEKLIPSDFITINTASWQELVATDRGFIMPEYQTRIDFFNSLARTQNPEFNLQAMVPPVGNKDTGIPMMNKYNIDPTGFIILNTRDEGRIANAAKFLDWYYSDEAYELVSWGKEGETYKVVDGKKTYITDENGTQANTLYGFGTYGTFTRMNPDAVSAFESEDIAKTRDMVLEHMVPYANPAMNLAFNLEEQAIRDEYEVMLQTYSLEKVSKFLFGQEPLSNFDAFVDDMNKMGLQKLLGAYESAYARVK